MTPVVLLREEDLHSARGRNRAAQFGIDLFDENGQPASNVIALQPLQPGESYTATVTVSLSPSATGTHVVVVTDATVQWLGEDRLYSGGPARLSYTVTNVGEFPVWPGTEYWKDQLWISADLLDEWVVEGPISSASRAAYAHEVRVVTQLDEQLDLRSFRLGDLRIGDISVHVPQGQSVFQGDFDFTEAKGFLLRVSAAVDPASGQATWLLQAIDPLTGELLEDPDNGLLPPNDALDAGAGYVSYTVVLSDDAETGALLTAQARVFLDNAPPEDTATLWYLVDAQAPGSSLSVAPMALAEAPDGSILVSGGPSRNLIYRFDIGGGLAEVPLAELDYPVFNMAFDAGGRLWATTGGGPLLQLDAETGEILRQYAAGITIALAVEPATGLIYVSSSGGIEAFDPETETFSHYSRDRNLRVGSLAFDAAGTLWVTTWPDRQQVVRFTERARAETVLVLPTSRGPDLREPAARTVGEGESLRFYLNGEDPDGETVRYFSNMLPPGATLHPNTGLFEWTPAYYQPGEYTFPLSAASVDGTATVEAAVTVLAANGAPTFFPVDVWQGYEGEPIKFRPIALDPDNPGGLPPIRGEAGQLVTIGSGRSSLVYTAEGLPPGAQFDAETATFFWEPSYNAAGEYAVSFTATDDGGGVGAALTCQMPTTIVVGNVNRSPEIVAVANATVRQGDTELLSVQAADPDGNPLRLSAENALAGYRLPDFITFADDGGGMGSFVLAPAAGDRGDYVVTLVATDDGDAAQSPPATHQVTFVVTVETENDPPVLDYVVDHVAVVGVPLELVVRASDLDEEPFSWSASGLPAGATLAEGALPGTSVLRWLPTFADLGSHTVTVAGAGDDRADAEFRRVARRLGGGARTGRQPGRGDPGHAGRRPSGSAGQPRTGEPDRRPARQDTNRGHGDRRRWIHGRRQCDLEGARPDGPARTGGGPGGGHRARSAQRAAGHRRYGDRQEPRLLATGDCPLQHQPVHRDHLGGGVRSR